MNAKAFKEEIDEERNKESIMTRYDSWLSDNLRDCKEEFIEEHKDEIFSEYICDHEDDFADFCKAKYHSEQDRK